MSAWLISAATSSPSSLLTTTLKPLKTLAIKKIKQKKAISTERLNNAAQVKIITH